MMSERDLHGASVFAWLRYQAKRRREWNVNTRRHGFDFQCPNCRGWYCDPQVRGDIAKVCDVNSAELHVWRCGNCEHESEWIFGAAPIPLPNAAKEG